MRLNRENTYIENNLYPCAGMRDHEAQADLVRVLTPYEPIINQLFAAVFFENIPLFAALFGLNILLLFISFYQFFSPLFLFLLLPFVLGLFYANFQKMLETPIQSSTTLNEKISGIWKPLVILWQVGFFIYRTLVCPNVIDDVAIIIVLVILAQVNKIINLFNVLLLLTLLLLILPAALRGFSSKKAE